MSDLVVLGTDTDVGKTTFALLWLAAFADRFEYWKPIETGPSDKARIVELIPEAVVHPVIKRLSTPVAPPLAARLENDFVPTAAEIAAYRPTPHPDRCLLIETFGSPFSPLNEQQDQIPLIQAFAGKTVLVSCSHLGAIGRTVQCLVALAVHEIKPLAVILIGPVDDYARATIQETQGTLVFDLRPPEKWDAGGIRSSAEQQAEILHKITACFRNGTLSTRHSVLRTKGMQPSFVDRDRRAIWHPYTSLRETDPPVECVGTQDEFLFLADGRKVIDGISSWWTILHGHRHPVLMAALHDAARAFDHVHFAGVTHAPAVELAELMLGTAPWPGSRVFYSDNGSTAVEVALKMAYQYWCHQGQPGRTHFIGFEGGYHGDTFGAMAVSRDLIFFGRFEPLLFQAEIVPLSAEHLEDALKKHKGKVAAVILEPLVQGAGGMRMHSPALLKNIAEVTRNHNVLFIADEVMTGGGRTGPLWAHQAAGVKPDLICAAKTLAGGILPLAATLAGPHIVSAWDTADPARTFFHGHSFTAHPLACAVAVANWKMLTAKPHPIPKQMEEFWSSALEPLRGSEKICDVRICGTIAAVELDVPGGYLADVGRQLRQICLEEGVLLRPLGSVLYAMPPLCTSRESLDRIAGAMIRAVDAGTSHRST
jgi:adenosylmethionine-8-amino-7-oxononanoate aminotransferase